MGIRFTRPSGDYDRTLDYRFTTDSKNDPSILELKKSVANHNKWVRGARRKGFDWADGSCKLQRVRIKPRGPRNESHYHTMTHEATHFDVYVGFDTHNHYQLERELETGLTAGELRRMDNLRMQAREIEWTGLARKNGWNNGR